MKYPTLNKILGSIEEETIPFLLTLPGKGAVVVDLSPLGWHNKFELMKDKEAAGQIKQGLSKILKKAPKEPGMDVLEAFREGSWKLKPVEH